MQDRREVLLGLAAVLGGTSVLAGCSEASEQEIAASIAPTGDLRFYTPEQYDFVSKLSDAIIPTTDTPGALDAGVPDYLDSMMHVWASDDTQNWHRRVLAAIGEELGSDFTKMPQEDRTAMVARLDSAAFSGKLSDPAGNGYRNLKSMISDIYYSSRPGATQELHYEAVPGRWDGDIALSEVGKTWYN